MSCAAFQNDLTDAALSALAPERATAWRVHLETCAVCQSALAREQQLFAAMDRAIAASVAGEPSPQFAAAVRARIAGEVEPQLLAAINRGVAATVAEEPSPQFAAAVRARIADEAATPAPWFLGWRWLAPVGALAAFALLIWLTLPKQSAEPPLARNPAPNPVPTVQPAKNVEPPQPAPKPNVQQVAGRRPRLAPPKSNRNPWGPAGRPGDELDAPAVQVSAAEFRTLARFYQGVQSGAYNARALLGEPIVIARAVEPMDTPELKTVPIEVKELSVPSKTADPGTNR